MREFDLPHKFDSTELRHRSAGNTASIFTSTAKAGYSLVELMVVLSVIGMLLTMSWAGMKSFDRARHKAPMGQVMADFKLARSMAVAEKRDVRITFLNSAHQYSIWVDRNDNGSVDSGEAEIRTFSDRDISLYSSPSLGTFKPDGTFATSSFLLYVSVVSPSGHSSCYVSPSGHVEVLETAGS